MSGLFSSPDPPTPPNPYATASAQTGTNVSTAIANSYLGNVNQNTPQGSLRNDVTGEFSYTDPTTGQTYNIPRWTATQTLNPQAQQTFDQTQRAQSNMAGMAEQQSGALRSLLGSTFNPNAPGMGEQSWLNTNKINPNVNFNAVAYLQQNPDVAAAARAQGQDPTQFAQQHYQASGMAEGRGGGLQTDPFQTSYGSGGNITRDFDPGFDAQTYLQQNPDVANAARASGQNPADFARQHYQASGMAEGRGGGGMQIQSGYGPADNFSADRQRIEESMFQRVNPQIQQDEARLRQQLADQGIRYGSQAYSGAYDPFNRAVTDTRLGIVQAGGQEQQRMNQMAAQLAQFQNAAQQQGYTQQLGRAGFQNQAQQQAEQQNAARAAFGNQAAQSQFEQAMGRGQFFNQAATQQFGLEQGRFNAQNMLRNQALQEQYQLRGQPINEITALLSGSQVQQPNFINAARSQIPTTDVAGLINQNFAQQNDIFKTQSSSWNDLVGGLLGAGGKIGGAALMSDVRVKENIAPMGSIMSPKGELPLYEYDYKGEHDDGKRHFGPMAQDVERLDPKAVKSIDGIKHIKTDKLASIFGKKAA